MSGPLRGGANGRVDALVATAPADVAVHGVINLLVGRSRGLCQKRGRLHDLAGLAITALRHTEIAPRYLDWMFAFGVETFDGDHRLARDVRHDDAARADRFAVEMDGAGAAERNATAELRSGQAKPVAQIPHERHRRIAVERALLSIHFNGDHYFPPM